MKALTGLLIAAAAFGAQGLNVQVTGVQILSNHESNSGDTPKFEYADTNAGGLLPGGGHAQGTCGDCSIAGSTGSMMVLELTTYDPTNVNNTNVSVVNGMSGYGTTVAAAWLGDSNVSAKPTSYISWHGVGFLSVCATENNAPFYQSVCFVLRTPDAGIHWCNPATFATGGSGGANTCDSGNWSATGDSPGSYSSSNFPWASGTEDFTSKMTRMDFTQTCTKDFSVGCPSELSGGACDPSKYVCFISSSSDWTKFYTGHIDMTCAGGPQSSSCYSWWNGSSFDTNLANAASIANGYPGTSVQQDYSQLGTLASIIYVPESIMGTGKGFYLAAGRRLDINKSSTWLTLSTTSALTSGFTPQWMSAPASAIPDEIPTMMLCLLQSLGTAANPQFLVTWFAGKGPGGTYSLKINQMIVTPTPTSTLQYRAHHIYSGSNSDVQLSETASPLAIPSANLVSYIDFFDGGGNTNWPYTGPQDLVSNNPCTQSGGWTWTSTGLTFSNGPCTSASTTSLINGDVGWTWAGVVSSSKTTTTTQQFFYIGPASASYYPEMNLVMNSAGAFRCNMQVNGTSDWIMTSNSNWFQPTGSGGGYTPNTPMFVAVTKAPGTPTTSNWVLYVNGVAVPETLTSGSTWPGTAVQKWVAGAASLDAGHPLYGQIYIQALFTTALTSQQIWDLGQVFKAALQRAPRSVSITAW